MKKFSLILIMLLASVASYGDSDKEQLKELGYEASIRHFKFAVLNNDLQAIKIFIDSGTVDEFRKDNASEDPLGILIFDGSPEAFTLWLDYFKPKAADAYERTMFMFIGFGKEEHALLLVDYIKEPDFVMDDMLPLLAFTAQRGMSELASKLLEIGANPNNADKFDNLPASLAIKNNHLDTFKTIVKSTNLENSTETETRILLSSIIRSESYREEALVYLFESTNFPLTKENYQKINELALQVGSQRIQGLNEKAFSEVKTL